MFACCDDKETSAKPARYRRTNDITVTIFYLEYYFLQLWLRPIVYTDAILLLSCRSELAICQGRATNVRQDGSRHACRSLAVQARSFLADDFAKRKLSRIVRFESQPLGAVAGMSWRRLVLDRFVVAMAEGRFGGSKRCNLTAPNFLYD